MRPWDPTRSAGLARLHDVAPRLGTSYARHRNTDRGPDHPPTTAMLSPWLRRRLLTEPEVIQSALAAHGPAAEKFVQEVAWRSYFKGHLELRPHLWPSARRLAEAGHAQLQTIPALRRRYDDAIAGRTGIDAFDHWATELQTCNWLHNHARMWFASIWIFTLRLPWALGAAHFMAHLLDGDPASNTLSWRWVAGLHTPGKHYVATRDNIRRYTDDRFDPVGLDEAPESLTEPPGPSPRPLPPPDPPPPDQAALLLHLDDLHPESLVPPGLRIRRIAGMVAHAPGAAAPVRAFDRAALDDALARAANAFDAPVVPYEQGWNDGRPVVTPYAPIGPTADALPPALRLRRPWDDAVWPHAGRGFFKVKDALPRILRTMGLT